MDEIEKHYTNQKERITKLSFFKECKGIEGFPQDDMVYHMNVIGLVGEFGGSCITLKEAKEIALQVSGSYEGLSPSYSSLAKNFDGAGMSWGIIQFNFGQDTLGALLRDMKVESLKKFNTCFENEDDLKSLNNALASGTQSQIDWAIDMQTNHETRWKKIFNSLAEVSEFQEIQLKAVERYDNTAINIIEWMRAKKPELMQQINLSTFIALHDLAIQQGSIEKAKSAINIKLNSTPPLTQDEFIRLVVTERGATASSKWRADCISRRLGILNRSSTAISHSSYQANRDNASFKLIKKGYICGL